MISPHLQRFAVPIAGLQPDPKNVRSHGERNVATIKASLEKFGQLKPIVIRAGMVLAGNGTLEAAKALGWSEIAAVEASELTAKQAREFSVADNKASDLAEWDLDNLADVLSEIDDGDFLGFDADEIGDLLERKQAPFATVRMPIADLKQNSRNYRIHPDDQILHIIRSIEQHGFYRNVVVARDGTVLAGHGVVQAATTMGRKVIPVVRMDVGPEDPQALKVMAADNEIGRLAEVDDRALTELLKELATVGELDGTGFDREQLAALAMVTRPSGELADFDEAAHWAGLPQYVSGAAPLRVIVQFDNEEDRTAFLKSIGAQTIVKRSNVFSIWWPDKPREDLRSVKFVDG